MIIKLNGNLINVYARKVSPIGKFTGLMFKSSKTENLLFEFSSPSRQPIHSYFVFFSFLALWLDKNNNIIEHNLVKPFTTIVKPSQPVKYLLEIPINKKNQSILEIIVGGKI